MKRFIIHSITVSTLAISSSYLSAQDLTAEEPVIKQTLASQRNQAVITIADKIESHISMIGAFQIESSEQVIDVPGASFIKVHFSRLNLPAGAYVEISNADGTEVYRYGNGLDTPKTINSDIGDNGVTSFSSMSISGSYAVIRMGGNQNGIRARQHRVEIDHYMQGYAEERIEELLRTPLNTSGDISTESTCGVNERRDVQCWADTHSTEVDRARPVARLLMNGSGLCTGWRVGSDNRMFTNNHCVDSNSTVQSTEVWFNYQNTSCGGSTTTTPTKVTGASMLQTDNDLDYTLFTINNFNNVSSFGYLGLDPREAILQEQIYIPQHGAGNPKELAIESDQNTGNLCRIDDVSATGRAANTDMGYQCDTTGGSSGSPVLASSSNKVIALHHFGGCNNQGVKISRIWTQVSNHFGGVVPIGDDDTSGSNEAPTASFSSDCNGLACTFDSSGSSDTDGTINGYSWDFGDSSSSTESNPGHSYASSGTYTVSLTVTDDDGASGTISNNVIVSDGSTGGNELQNGVQVSNLSGVKNEELRYTFEVPANAESLIFEMSGGSGDADLYVNFGSEPTTSSYECRPYSSGNNETCTISNIQTGTYHVMIRGFSAFSGTSITATYAEGSATTTFTNNNDVNIPDNNATGVTSSIDVTSAGTSNTVSVAVDIIHTYQGDLIVDLIDPDGGVHNLHNRSGGSANNINQTYSVDVGSATKVGTWQLRVSDRANIDTGHINSWSITL